VFFAVRIQSHLVYTYPQVSWSLCFFSYLLQYDISVWCIHLIGVTEYNVTVTSDPIGYEGNILEYSVGSNITLTCMVTPSPPSDSEFSWSCSTGCFVDMEIKQSVNISELEVTDSGEINCSVIVDGVEYTSETINFRVEGNYIKCIQLYS